MKARVAFLVIGGVVVALAGTGCGGGDDTEPVPMPDELAADLLAPGDRDRVAMGCLHAARTRDRRPDPAAG